MAEQFTTYEILIMVSNELIEIAYEIENNPDFDNSKAMLRVQQLFDDVIQSMRSNNKPQEC